MVDTALAFQSSTNSTTDLAVIAIGIVLSVIIAGALLARQRSRVTPPDEGPNQPAPRLLTSRQKKVMQKLEPVPELPTLMDLVREEIAEAGVDKIPGHEGLPEHIMLKVFRRDHAVVERCTHGDYRFVVAEDVEPADALESTVKLICDQCGPIRPEPTSETESEAPGTNPSE